MTRFTFVGLGLILSVCLLTSPALAQLGTKNLTGLWLFDEGSGDVAADSSNSALDATVVEPDVGERCIRLSNQQAGDTCFARLFSI